MSTPTPVPKRKVFISSPLMTRGLWNFTENLELAKKLCRCVLAAGHIPVAAHVFCPQFLNDAMPDERALGMEIALELLYLCDEVWIYSRHGFSDGMQKELEAAQERGIESREWPEPYLPENVNRMESF